MHLPPSHAWRLGRHPKYLHRNCLRATGPYHGRKDIKCNRAAHRRFLRGCHYGYDLVQRKVAAEVIALETRAREAEKELKTLRADRGRVAELREYLHTLHRRQIILRRLIDSILFTMLAPNEWVLRHFSLSDQIHRVDPRILERTIEIATERNREERLIFSLVGDLTTAVQVGDLIEIDRSNLAKRSWRIVELKEGRVNEVLSSLIEEHGGELTEQDLSILRESSGPEAVKQVKRMLAQQNRQKGFERLQKRKPNFSLAPSKELHILAP
jgi:hypothetical protein